VFCRNFLRFNEDYDFCTKDQEKSKTVFAKFKLFILLFSRTYNLDPLVTICLRLIKAGSDW